MNDNSNNSNEFKSVSNEKTYDFESNKELHDQKTFENSQSNNTFSAHFEADDESETLIDKKQMKKKLDKPLKMFGVICLGIFALAIPRLSSSVDASEAAIDALNSQVSTAISVGTIISKNDESLTQMDYTITHNYNKEEAKIWIWDYAAEDGDYVQVYFNGEPISEVFMVKHKPIELTVPSVGMIQVKGIKDGGGGITYAINFEINNTSYFNFSPEGEYNEYTLIFE